MLPARQSPLHLHLLQTWVRWKLRRHFHSLEALTYDGPDLTGKNWSYPTILYGTHHSWWDTFFLLQFWRALKQEPWVMMEARNLARFPFFRKVGVFGVDLDDAKGRSESLLYALRLLKHAGDRRRVLLVYPQGRLVPYDGEWPPFQGGVAELLRLVPAARAVPVSLHIRHGKYMLPEARFGFGKAFFGTRKPETPVLEEALRSLDGCVRASWNESAVEPTGRRFLLPPHPRLRGTT
ncbi:MAG: 1-acyl-sn-glycerol-3-phosphate acyltransferase [Opitutales bacterium]